jgi:hypothetical protein
VNAQFASGLRSDASFAGQHYSLVTAASGAFASAAFRVPVNGAGQIKTRASAANVTMYVFVTGFVFPG